jgi:galactose mutarotase-like enzyme
MLIATTNWEKAMVSIENDLFSAGIRLKGAELASLKDKTNERELIWQADPEIWGGSAPILFPIVGKLKDGKTRINGTPYETPKHGILRIREATVLEHGPTHAVFQFESDNQTLELFPFPFIFKATFRLIETGLLVDYEISNTGTEPMLFSVGSHPAFALDLELRALSDYFIEFSEPETLDLYGFVDGFLGTMEENFLREKSFFRLRESMFHENALIFKNIKSRKIRLNPTGIEVDIRNHPHLGIWQVPGAPYVCIEPWHSFDDAADSDGIFENKPGIISLPANEKFETGYAVRITR